MAKPPAAAPSEAGGSLAIGCLPIGYNWHSSWFASDGGSCRGKRDGRKLNPFSDCVWPDVDRNLGAGAGQGRGHIPVEKELLELQIIDPVFPGGCVLNPELGLLFSFKLIDGGLAQDACER